MFNRAVGESNWYLITGVEHLGSVQAANFLVMTFTDQGKHRPFFLFCVN